MAKKSDKVLSGAYLVHIASELLKMGIPLDRICKIFKIPRTTVRDQFTSQGVSPDEFKLDVKGAKIGFSTKKGGKEATFVDLWESETPPTKEEIDFILHEANIDTDVYEVGDYSSNVWHSFYVSEKETKKGKGSDVTKMKHRTVTLWQIKVSFRRRSGHQRSILTLLDQLENKRLTMPVPKFKTSKKRHPRAIEYSICDPHIGGIFYKGGSDAAWNMDMAEQLFMWLTERLIYLGGDYGPFEECVIPMGNDFLHADNYFHTTTAGTAQPEMAAYHAVVERCEKILIWFVDRLLKEHKKVVVKVVPGNHARQTEWMLGRFLMAWYRNDKRVKVDCTADPYKFWSFGSNLIGFEHGHSVAAVRLAALMANETRLTHWKDARYCEWHLGDQHRKGSGKPSMFEEQGVSVEYLPALTPPNEWHRIKSFNWQKRGAMAFVYDKLSGPIARLQANIDSYTELPMGLDSV